VDWLVRSGLHAGHRAQAPEGAAVLAQIAPLQIFWRNACRQPLIADAVVFRAILERELAVQNGVCRLVESYSTLAQYFFCTFQYTIESDERIAANAPVVATLRRGAEVAQSVLDEPLVLGAAMSEGRAATSRGVPRVDPMPAYAAPALPSRGSTRPLQRNVACADCAVVESVRAVETDGRDGVAGAVAGGLLGAILGHQIGHGDLRGVAGIVGAIGGALTGRAIERASTRQVRYDVVLRLPDGGSQVHSYDAPPPLRVGERIRVPPVITARTSRPDSPD